MLILHSLSQAPSVGLDNEADTRRSNFQRLVMQSEERGCIQNLPASKFAGINSWAIEPLPLEID